MLLSTVLGYDIHKTSMIGFSIVAAKKVRIEARTKIGHFTVVRNLALLEMAEASSIGNFNTISGAPLEQNVFFRTETDRRPQLILHPHATVTHSHLIDCCNSVIVGAFATVAGWRTQILTHSIDIASNHQRSAPVSIGAYSFVGTSCILLMGATLPDRSILAAGSVLSRAQTEQCSLYAGVPATKVKDLDPNSAYFSRQSAQVA